MYVHCTVLPPSQIISFGFSRYSPFLSSVVFGFGRKSQISIVFWSGHTVRLVRRARVKETHRSFHAQLNPHAAMHELACMLPVKYYAQVPGGTLVSAARAWLAWSHAGVIA